MLPFVLSCQLAAQRRYRLAGPVVAVLVWLSFCSAVPALAIENGAGGQMAAESPAPADAATKGRFVVVGTGGLNLRLHAAPGLSTPIVGRLPEGTSVAVSNGAAVELDEERWLSIVAGELRGWVAARYLTRQVALAPVVRHLPASAGAGERAAAAAESVLGRPYAWGGTAPTGFDCSGLVQWAYQQAGLRLPRTTAEQIRTGQKLGAEPLTVGDLVFFENTYRPGLSHVGLYLGDERFVHAADEARGVTVSDLRDGYWKLRYVGAVRPGRSGSAPK